MNTDLEKKVLKATDDLSLSVAYEISECSNIQDAEIIFNELNSKQSVSIIQLRQTLDNSNKEKAFNHLIFSCKNRTRYFETTLHNASRENILTGIIFIYVEQRSDLRFLPKVNDPSIINLRKEFKKQAAKK